MGSSVASFVAVVDSVAAIRSMTSRLVGSARAAKTASTSGKGERAQVGAERLHPRAHDRCREERRLEARLDHDQTGPLVDLLERELHARRSFVAPAEGEAAPLLDLF